VCVRLSLAIRRQWDFLGQRHYRLSHISQLPSYPHAPHAHAGYDVTRIQRLMPSEVVNYADSEVIHNILNHMYIE